MRSQQEVAAMSCPVCRVPLAMSDRQGIEIDYCPQCRGVWLDRGELDKIIERSAPPAAQQAAAQPAPQQQPVQPQPLHQQPAPPPQQGPWDSQPRHGQPHHGYDTHGDQRYRDDHGYRGKGAYGKPYKKRKSWLEELFD